MQPVMAEQLEALLCCGVGGDFHSAKRFLCVLLLVPLNYPVGQNER